MDINKIKQLGAAGRWDAVCGSRKLIRSDSNLANAAASGIYNAVGRCGESVKLFKTLMTDSCSYDCKYCQNSTHCTKQKNSYEPEELAKVFMKLHEDGYVDGLFLSSGITGDPDKAAEKMVESIKLVRQRYNFRGYIHLKVLPGQNRDLIKAGSQYADRMSINLETPNRSRLNELSSVKEYRTDILRRQAWIRNINPVAGQTTQMIIGGAGETDLEILKMVDWEYENMKMQRVFFSAFSPIPKTPLENQKKTPLDRQNRLYNVDYMFRKYDIDLKEIKGILDDGNLPRGDPKMHLARNYFDSPVDLNEASKEELLRIPGIGPTSAEKILKMQQDKIKIKKRLDLKRAGIFLTRAEPFITLGGSTQRTLGMFG